MPLLDHFRPPLKDEVGWHSFHHAWCTYIPATLNRILPKHYRATPHIQYGLEVDVAALDVRTQAKFPKSLREVATIPYWAMSSEQTNGHTEKTAWQPPPPTQLLPFSLLTESVEVLIYNRPFQQDKQITLAIWHEALPLGEPLPTMPLWLRREFCAPLDLEATYVETCQSLRIPMTRGELANREEQSP